jgi:hypothetical protein
MAYTLKLDVVSPDGDNHVSYVQILDDSNNIVGSICVPYSGNDEQFNTDLNSKLTDAITKIEAKKTITDKVTTLLSAVDPTQIISTIQTAQSVKSIK